MPTAVLSGGSATTEVIIELKTKKQNMESKKNDRADGKPMWELLPLPDLEDVVKVYTFGAQKYGPNTWRHLDNGMERYKAALMRHLVESERGNAIDTESGLPHLAHVVWNAIAMLSLYHDSRSVPVTSHKSHPLTRSDMSFTIKILKPLKEISDQSDCMNAKVLQILPFDGVSENLSSLPQGVYTVEELDVLYISYGNWSRFVHDLATAFYGVPEPDFSALPADQPKPFAPFLRLYWMGSDCFDSAVASLLLKEFEANCESFFEYLLQKYHTDDSNSRSIYDTYTHLLHDAVTNQAVVFYNQ